MRCPASVASSVADDSEGMGRYGPHYRRQPTQRRGPEVSTTILRTEISGRQNRLGPYFCPYISVVNPPPLPLHGSQLQFCSVGRIGPSPSHLFESARLRSHPLLIAPELLPGGCLWLTVDRWLLRLSPYLLPSPIFIGIPLFCFCRCDGPPLI